MQSEANPLPVANIFDHPIHNPCPSGLVGNLANPLLSAEIASSIPVKAIF